MKTPIAYIPENPIEAYQAGFQAALNSVIVDLTQQFPNPTLGIKKAIALIEALGDTE